MMKEIKILFCAFLAILAASSCDRKLNLPDEADNRLTFTADAGQMNFDTKTTTAFRYDVLWEQNDKIMVTYTGGSDTFTLTEGAGTTCGLFKQDGTSPISGIVDAYYPATLIDNLNLVWPKMQSYTQAPPMYSKGLLDGSAKHSLGFSSLGGMIQFVLSTKGKDVMLQNIEIKDGSKTLSGAFYIDDSGKAVITATDKAGIIVNFGTGVPVSVTPESYFISIPAGKYTDLTVTFTDTHANKYTVHSSTMPEVKRNVIGKVTLTLDFPDSKISDHLNGEFSVSSSKKVYFSRGNLFYDDTKTFDPGDESLDGDVNSYSFEPYQFNTPGTWRREHVGVFYWSHYRPYARAQEYDDPEAKHQIQFFTNQSKFIPDGWYYTDYIYPNSSFTVAGVKGVYRVLMKAEWDYLYSGRANAAALRKDNVTVNGVKGLVLAPDNYTGTIKSSYTVDQWSYEELDGLVFLPEADKGYWTGTSYYPNVDHESYEWANAINYAYAFKGTKTDLMLRYGALRVRLVTNVE